MGRIISVLNYKGGTGKTSTVVNLAAGLAIRGSRVLCVDLDPQGSLATYLGVNHDYSLTNLLLEQVDARSCIVYARDNLDLIASDTDLHIAEGTLWQKTNRHAATMVLTDRLKSINSYDYVLLDHSPSASLLNESGLLFAQQILIPVSMEYLALVGVRQVIEIIRSFTKYLNHHVQLACIVPTFYSGRQRKDREIMEILQGRFADRVAEPIRLNVSLSEAPGYHMSIYEYAPRSTGAVDYAQLVERVAHDGK